MQSQLVMMVVLASSAQIGGFEGPPPAPPRIRPIAAASVKYHDDPQRITLEVATSPAPAGEDDDPPPARPIGPIDLKTAVVERENFDRWLFADAGYEAAHHKYLDDMVRTKVDAAARKYRLTEPQREKLRLAGKGDIKRFFDQVEDKRTQFEIERRSLKTGRAALRRLEPLTQAYLEGPFGDGSLFAKALQKIKDDQKTGR